MNSLGDSQTCNKRANTCIIGVPEGEKTEWD